MSDLPSGRSSHEPAVVALGGGHGLAASLPALRRVTDDLTAVVTVADDGGSSGRLRRELGVLPPGDLRMALAALCGDDEWGQTWSRVVQHRFRSAGELHGHAVGNLLIVALWELLGDSVAGLDWVGRLLGAQGRVLPMSSVPLDIEAVMAVHEPVPGEGRVTVRGQVAVATTPGRVRQHRRCVPEQPPACPEAVAAVREADWVVLGPGSWFTSVIPHLLVPELADALCCDQRPTAGGAQPRAAAGRDDRLRARDPPRGARRARAGPDASTSVLADTAAVPDPVALRAGRAVRSAPSWRLAPMAQDDGTPSARPRAARIGLSRLFAPDAASDVTGS